LSSSGVSTYFQTDGEGRFRANPASGTRFVVAALPPEGQPYLSLSKRLDWPKGAIERSIDLALPRGVPIRGKVVEEATGGPVADAGVWYEAPPTPGTDSFGGSRPATTSGDGSFTIAAPPGPGHLVIQGPSDHFVLREIGSNRLYRGQSGGLRIYSHAFIACDPKPGENPEVQVALRRGATVEGRLIGPDGRPIREARLIGRTFLLPFGQPGRRWRGGSTAARDGRFVLHGLDPGAEVPVHVLEPKGKLGATATLSGKSGADGPVTIRLEPCATARARLVDRDGKPVAGFRDPRLIVMVVTPGLPSGVTSPPEQLAAHEDILSRFDPVNYGDAPASGADGRILFPALIPGASYSVRIGPRNGPPTFRKDFTVKPGETLDLGDILVEKP
jgi:hypothetical protein